ncbi:hypothetical protein [Haladaptatus sp. CMAA 1911]|uniref:hypothetical protein n=1 Tax=Haladaptatus sp. CMAA 1911 TaxID=3368987 RepID=UPI003754DC0D
MTNEIHEHPAAHQDTVFIDDEIEPENCDCDCDGFGGFPCWPYVRAGREKLST